MKRLDHIAGASLMVTLLAACSVTTGNRTSPVVPQLAAPFERQFTASSFKSLYNFDGTPDGGSPYAGLLAVNGTLYGTTWGGGAAGVGTVFTVSTSGTESVLYSFKGSPDGSNPWARLTVVGGSLYGTTSAGGTACAGSGGCGAVFKLTVTGERVLHSFLGANKNDGAYPQYNENLTSVKGVLYGTTYQGGNSKLNWGTVFRVTTTGSERVLYRFGSKPRDGVLPTSGLIALNGKLYGTTSNGGIPSLGTVFEVSTSGEERVLYRFKGGTDGAGPVGTLIALNGKLYGTTEGGGTGCMYNRGCGTVFEVSTSGRERVLYRFEGHPDGAEPEAGLEGLTGHNGMLYGTTSAGGTGCSTSGSLSGCGTIFEVSTSGKERVLHSFQGVSDGAYPLGQLTAIGSTLYGTTSSYGTGACVSVSGIGCGTVFAVTP
jgi:uncharacterized repeat protein (TIGR03803 family)